MARAKQITSALTTYMRLTGLMGWRPASWRTALLTLGIASAAVALRVWLTPWLSGAQFITFFPAVIVITLLCGAAAGLLSVPLFVLAAWWMLSPDGLSIQEANSLLLFSLVALMDVAIISALLAANRALSASAERISRLNAELGEREALFRELLESAPDAMVIIDRAGRIKLINDETEKLFGYRRSELVGTPVERLMPERFRERHADQVRAFAGKPRTMPMGLGRELAGLTSTGAEFPVEVSLRALTSGPEGLITSAIRDISARKAAEDRQTLLIHELNHRVKNILAIVQSVAAQTFKGAESPAAFKAAFDARLAALALSHGILTRNDWTGADLGDLVREVLEPYRRDQGDACSLAGPPVRLNAKASVSLGMALGELATNAAKYGALSVDAGMVRVEWEFAPVGSEPGVRLVWREQGGPAVSRPARPGFGSRLIERGTAHELRGAARLAYEPGGLVCEIEFPLQDNVADGTGLTPPAAG